MGQGKQQANFERNMCTWNRDNCDTDGRRTNCDFMNSVDSQAKRVVYSMYFKHISLIL